jgi:hypothetical protein
MDEVIETPVGGVPDLVVIPAWEGSHLIQGEDGDRYKIELYDGDYPRIWWLEYHDGDDDEGDTGLFISEAVLIQLADLLNEIVASLSRLTDSELSHINSN